MLVANIIVKVVIKNDENVCGNQ